MRILVINGPNLNMLGGREKHIYGAKTYGDLVAEIEDAALTLGVEVKCFQSNHEGAIVDEIQAALGAFDAIVINPPPTPIRPWPFWTR
jgi:3-dehydroquinate dehydratase-2